MKKISTLNHTKLGFTRSALLLLWAVFLWAVFVSTFAGAQTQLVSWDVSGVTNYGVSPFTPTTVNANLENVVGLTRGSGLSAGTGGVIGGWGATNWGDTQANAIAGDDVIYFGFKPKAGYSVSLTGVNPFSYRRSGTGPDQGIMQYTLDAGANYSGISQGAISFGSSSASGADVTPTINLTADIDLQQVSSNDVGFRIVPFGATSAAGTFYIYDVGTSSSADFSINGRILGTTETSLALAACKDIVGTAKTFSVKGDGLTATDLTITAPADFEISIDDVTYSSSLTLTPAAGSVDQQYYVRLKSGLADGSYSGSISVTGGGFTAAANLGVTLTGTVHALPTAVVNPVSQICVGDAFPFVNIDLTGSAPWTLTYSDGTSSIEETGVVSTMFSVQSAAEGEVFTATALTDNNGCVALAGDLTGSATVVVNPVPEVSAVATDGATSATAGVYNQGETISITATIDVGAGAYSWTGPDGFTAGNLATITVANATSAQAGTYTVTATDANLCTGTAEVEVVVYDNTIFVAATGDDTNTGSATSPLKTIQKAVDVAVATNTIEVAAGTYNEQVIVNKSLTILGPNATISPNTGTRVAEAILVNSANGRAFSIFSGNTDVVISGFKFDGGSPIHDGNDTNNPNTSDVTFSKNLVVNANQIYAGTSTSWADCLITDNKFEDINATATSNAMQVSHTLTTTITDNTFINVNYAAMAIDVTPTVTISGNTIDGTGFQAIQLAGAVGNATIENNKINDANRVAQAADRGAIRLYGSNFTGVVTISNNEITGGYNGIVVRNGENIIGKNISISENSITSLTSGKAIFHGGTGSLNATCNWFGTSDPVIINAQISGDVTFLPFGTNGTDDDLATLGFQPVAGSCTGAGSVKLYTDNTMATLTNSYFNIQDAVDAASSGNGIIVDAGTYNEQVIVNKSLTIFGSNAAISPNTGTRVAESILNGTFKLQSNDITIDGFEITGTGRAIEATGTGPWSNITIANNRMISNTGQQAVLNGFGVVTNTIGSSNWEIKNNLVSDLQSNDASIFVLLNIDGLDIDDNVIEHKNTSFTGRRGLNIDGGKNVNIRRNSIDLGLSNPASDNSDGAFTNARYNLQLASGNQTTENVLVDGNIMKGSYDGIITLGNGNFTNVDLTNNHISDMVLGIRFQAGTNNPIGEHTDFTIANNKISSANRSIYLQNGGVGTEDPYTNIDITENSLLRTFAGVALEVQSGSVVTNSSITADCNWYGVSSTQDVASKIVGEVDYTTWLVDGTDDQLTTTGFQPVTGSCDGSAITISSVTPTSATCNVGGTAVVTFSGGTAPYDISWTDGGTNTGSQTGVVSPYTITALEAATYTVTVTDANSSAVNQSVTIDYLPVTNITSGNNYATIQAAIDDASADDVIEVCDGSYTGDLTVNKALTINGANVGTAGTATRTDESVLLNSKINITATGTVTIDGFKFLRDDAVAGDGILVGGNTTATLTNNIFERNGSNTGSGIRAVATAAGAATKTISNNLFTGDISGGVFSGHKTWNNGIYVNGSIGTVNIQNNTFENTRTALNIDDHQAGIVVEGNTFSSNGTHISFGGTSPTTGSFTLGANNFELSGSAIMNLSNVADAFRLDVTTSSYKGTALTSATNADLFEFEAQLFHKGRSSRKGKVVYKANNQYVNNITTPFTKIDEIQNSVLYADANDIINLQAGTYNQRVVIDKSDVTLQGADADETMYIIDGTGLSGNGDGIQIANGAANVSIKQLTIQNFSGASGNTDAGIYAAGGNNGLQVDDVVVKDNVGGSGIYANGPVDGVSITNSTIEGQTSGARGIVIWNGFKQNITITGNTLSNNNCCGIELQDGTASAVNISNNTIDIGIGDNAIGLTSLNELTGPNLIDNNTITGGGRYGIEVKNPAGGVTISNNNVTLTTQNADLRDRAGIAVFRRGFLVGAGYVNIPNGVTVTGNTVTGYRQTSESEGFGIVVEGTNHTVSNNILENNDIGIQQQAGHTPYTADAAGDGDQANLTDLYFGRGNSPEICNVTLTGNTYTSNGVDERIVIGGGTGTIVTEVTPTVDDPADIEVCNGATIAATTFTGNNLPGVVYNWTNDNADIGLATSGTGDILSFVATNAALTPVTATITVTPNLNGCDGTPQEFTITVNPSPIVETIADQTVCVGESVNANSFSGNGTTYNWVSDNDAIGLALSGTGDIASFTTTNTSGVPQIAYVTVTPTFTSGSSTCVGESESFSITVKDDAAAELICQDDATIDSDAGLCSAVYNFDLPLAFDPQFFDGFENLNWSNSSLGWTNFNSEIARELSGTITAAGGAAYGLVNTTVAAQTGVFSRLGGYSSTFGDGFRTKVDVYIDLADPAVTANTYGFDVSTAASNQSGGHRRDFIFHTASNASGEVLVAGSNGTNFTRRNDLASLNHYAITTSGWYTFEWMFQDKGDGTLEVDMNLKDDTGTKLFTETRNTPADVIATEIGGNRYMWFTFIAADNLRIDNVEKANILPTTSDIASGSAFPVGTTTVTVTAAADACGNQATCTFDVTVNDVEAPVFTNCPTDAIVCSDDATYSWTHVTLSDICDLTGGLQELTYTLSGATTTASPVAVTSFDGSTQGIETFNTGVTTVTYSGKDAAGNVVSNACSFTVTVNEGAVVEAGTYTAICKGEGVMLGGSFSGAATSITWSDGTTGGSFTPNANDPLATYTPPANFTGTVTLTITSDDPAGPCTAATATTTLVVNPLPTVAITPVTPFCEGGTLTLAASVTGATTYEWSGPDGFTSTDANLTILNATAAASGNYTLTVTSANLCTATATVSVTVYPLPAAPTITSDNSEVCKGTNAVLSASCAVATDIFRWTTPPITQGTSSLSSTGTQIVTAPGTYTGYCESVNGCIGENGSITITEGVNCNGGNFIVITPELPFICPGSSVQLTASGCATGAVSWTATSGTVTGSTVTLSPAATTTYLVTCSTGGSTSIDVRVAEPNVVVTNNISTGKSVVKAVNTIVSNKSVGNPNVTPAPNVIYEAGNSITLTPGFVAQGAAVFKAEIKGCN